MTQTVRKTLKWLLCGGAFVAVIAMAGCGSSYKTAPQPIVDPSVSPARSGLFENSDTPEAPPPSVNIFGELNGAAPKPARQTGEAGFQQHTFLTEGYDANVAASPDGKWIAFASTRHSEHTDIYLQRVDGQ